MPGSTRQEFAKGFDLGLDRWLDMLTKAL
jgi:hypothetical protein